MNYNVSTIQNNFLTVTGFNQPADPQFAPLSTNLSTCLSGIKINDGSIPYLTLQNIKDLGINYSDFVFSEWNTTINYNTGNKIKYSFPSWTAIKTFAAGERCVYGGLGYESLIADNLNVVPETNLDKWKVLNETYSIYESLQANNAKQPDLYQLYWSESNLFNSFLESRLKSAISNVVNKCTENKNQILESKKLYYGVGKRDQVIENENKIVGLKFDFLKPENIKMKINRIGLYFTGPVTDLEIFLYNQNTKITSQKFTTIGNDFHYFDLTDFDLTTEKAGSYFLYYDQTGLTEKAINNNIFIPKNHSSFVRINTFEAAGITDLKDINDSHYVYGKSFIANIDYSILPDLTMWLTYNKLIFANCIKLQFAIDIYKMFLENDNTRSNRAERNLDINTIKASIFSADAETVNKQLTDAINNLRDSIGKAKIDNINLPTKGNLFNYIVDL